MMTDVNIYQRPAKIQIVSKIILKALNDVPKHISLIQCQGNVNVAYDVNTSRGDYIVRIRFGKADLNQFEREKCCTDIICDAHDWTPKIINIGLLEGNAYSIQKKVPGVVASMYQGDLSKIWEQVGSYCSFFHNIPVCGYLRDAFRVSTRTEGPWCQEYFDQLGSANNARLVQKGILSQEEFQLGLEALQPLASFNFKPTLAHGNISTSNIIVDYGGKAHLIDWGSCVGHMAIELDLSELLVFNIPQEHIQAYLKGHNLPNNFIELNLELLERLKLARCFINAHWLCESNSSRIEAMNQYIQKTRECIAMLSL
jgi:aminoglycoside phosphotransferase (APT) family kinase protein